MFALVFATSACASPQASSGSRAPALDVKAELSSSEAREGSLLLVTVRVPSSLKDVPVSGVFGEARFPFFAGEKEGESFHQAVIGVPIGHKPGKTQVEIELGEGESARKLTLPLTVLDGEYPIEHLKVDPRHVNPKKKDLIRIRREVAEVAAAYNTITRKRYWNGAFVLPIESPLTSPYGTKRFYNGELRNYHNGLDLKAKVGTPIRAAAPGRVVLAKDLFFTGKTVILDHGYGVMSVYAHMSKIRVKKGQIVASKQRLGLSGATGRVSGPHLHWSVVVHKAKVNPLEVVRGMP